MARVYPEITDEIRAFIEAQHMFFVASAPLAAEGHVNVSPKGLDCLRILSTSRVAYIDLTGSGNETSAHLQENGRITLMFCAFDGSPNILRLYGTGTTVLPSSPTWAELHSLFPNYPGARQIIVADVNRVQTSCGNGVPLYDFVGQRDDMITWAERQGEKKLASYRQKKNLATIDGLPTPLAEEVSVV